MTAVNKIDSNQTELRIAEEVSVGVLPATPVWTQLDPNDYSTFGAKIKTVARNPINAARQRKKGVVVDLDAQAGFGIDLTQDNMQSLTQGFLFSTLRTHDEIAAPTVDGTGNAYEPAAGGAGYVAGDLLFAKGSADPTNDGLKVVTGTPTAINVAVTDTTLVDESGSALIISRVGHEFGAGVVTIDASGALPKLHITGNVAASDVLTATGVFADAETVTINGKVYTLQSVLTNVDGHVKIGVDLATTLTNLKNAINLNGLGVPGTDYALSTTQNADVTAADTATTLTVTAKVSGTVGNAITATEVVLNAAWASATLTGGVGRSWISLGLTVGSWVCVGDDATLNRFATSANNGLKRIRVIANDDLTFDKSTLAMVTDAGAAKDIRVFFGRVCKNEVGSLLVRRSYQLERTLGAPDDASSAVQSEYLTGSIPNTLELDVKQADKVMMKLDFMSRDHETRSAVTGVKPGTRPVLQDADAFNATSHVVRLSLAGINPVSANPVDLFAFLTDLKLTVKNGVKPNKAVKFLGAFDNSAGTLTVDAAATAYFADVAAMDAVRNNEDVTLDLTLGNNNKGITIDMPLVTVGDALADVKQDTAIMMPITNAAATGAKLDVNLNHTILFQFWDYLPTLAA